MSDGEEKGEALPWPSSASAASAASVSASSSSATAVHTTTDRQPAPLEEAREQALQARRDVLAKQQLDKVRAVAAAASAASMARSLVDPFAFTPLQTFFLGGDAAAAPEGTRRSRKGQQMKSRSSASSSAAVLVDLNPLATLFSLTTSEGRNLWLCTHCDRTFELVGPGARSHMADVKRLHAEQQGSLSSSPPVVLTVTQRISAFHSKHPGVTLSPGGGGSMMSVGPINPAITAGTPLRPPAPSFNELMRATLTGVELEIHMQMESIGKRPVEPLVASAAVFPPSRAPAPRLPSDALESAFCLLTFAELGRAVLVCRDWRDAVGVMAPLEQSVWIPAIMAELPRERSSLTRHVREVHKLIVEYELNSLYSFSRRYVNVTYLDVSVTLTGCRLYFPPLLLGLKLQLHSSGTFSAPMDLTADEVTDALVDVSKLTQLTDFTLKLSEDQPDMDLSVLQRLKRLRFFALLYHPWNPTLSDRQIAALRDLTHLERFEFSCLDAPLLSKLLVRPHALQWKELSGFRRGLDTACAGLLSLLPSLTALDYERDLECNSLDFLDDLPEMRIVKLRFDTLISSRAVFEGLSHLNKLTHLQLMSSPLDTAQMTALVAKLPLLAVLDLQFSTRFDSLSYLSACPTPTRLLSLTVCSTAECKAPLLDLRYVHRFRCLQYLKLSHVFSEQMDSYTRSLFEPPSVILPSLQKLVLAYPGDEADLRYHRWNQYGPRPQVFVQEPLRHI